MERLYCKNIIRIRPAPSGNAYRKIEAAVKCAGAACKILDQCESDTKAAGKFV